MCFGVVKFNSSIKQKEQGIDYRLSIRQRSPAMRDDILEGIDGLTQVNLGQVRDTKIEIHRAMHDGVHIIQ